MSGSRSPFLIELAGKLGPPVFSATLVLCLLTRQFEPSHAVLLSVGAGLISLEYAYLRRRSG